MIKPKLTKKQFADALKKCKGFSGLAAKALGVHYRTVLRARQRWPELDVIAQDTRAELVETAEFKLLQQTQAGERWAVQYVLTNLHPDYKSKAALEHTGADGGSIKTENVTRPDLSKLSPEELALAYDIGTRLLAPDGPDDKAGDSPPPV